MAYPVPLIYEETHKGERSYDVWSRLLKDRIIFISGYISTEVANVIIAQLLFLQSQDQEAEVQIYLNSFGGETMACLAIYDAMTVTGLACRTYCIGQCVSEAIMLLAGGLKGKRYAMPNSRMIIRQPKGAAGGQASDIAIQAKQLLALRSRLYELLALHTHQSLERIERDVQRDFVLTPQMAQEYGIIDHVMTSQVSGKLRGVK